METVGDEVATGSGKSRSEWRRRRFEMSRVEYIAGIEGEAFTAAFGNPTVPLL